MAQEIIIEMSGKFRSEYPDIPLPPDVDLNQLVDPMFVTLPIGQVNARSRGAHGRVYTERAVQSLVRQVNEMRPEGGWGHMRPDDIGTRYDPPALRWLAAQLDEKGKAWGKALVLTEDAKAHFATAKATNGRVATSVWGDPPTTDGEKVLDFALRKIDIADPTFAGIPAAIATPKITREMGELNMEPQKDITAEMLAEVKRERDTAQTELGKLQALVEAAKPQAALVAEMQSVVGAGKDILAEMRALVAERDALRKTALKAAIGGVIAEAVKLEALRPIIAEMVGEVADEAAARERVKALLESDSIKAIAKAMTTEQMGPNAVTQSGDNKGEKPEDFEKRMRERAQHIGVA